MKKKLSGGQFWSNGYFVNTVSKFGSEATIRNYVKKQGMEVEYIELHYQTIAEQLTLF